MDFITGQGGGGGKGGGGSAHTPQEAPDTLRSNSVAYVIKVLSEGPVEGIVGDMKGVFVAKTPVQNADGTFNFNGIDFQFRHGTPDQTPVEGFDASGNEVDVGVRVKKSEPITRTVTNLDANAVRVTINVPALVKTDMSNGNTNPSAIDLAIDIQPEGGTFQEAYQCHIQGKNTSVTQKSYRMQLPGKGPWQVRVRRLTDDSTKQELVNNTEWSSYTEIIEGQFTYPHLSYVAIRASARQFGQSLGDMTFKMRGRIISVPDNYDPIARTYEGIWTGKFKQAWTNNPAWIYYDLTTNRRYGAKQRRIDKWALYNISKYCDVMVDDGKGGKEPRFVMNVVLNDRQPALKVLDTIASVFHGIAYLSSDQIGSSVSLSHDAPSPDDGKLFFGPANTVGDITTTGTNLKQRHTVANVTWNNPAEHFERAVTQVKLNDAIRRYGWQPLDVTAFGASSEGQAQRFGLAILVSEYTETETIKFSTLKDYAGSLALNQVVKVQIGRRQGDRLHGRLALEQVPEQRTYVLDKVPEALHTNTSDWTLTVRLPDGEMFKSKVTSVDANKVRVADLCPQVPVAQASWMLESEQVHQAMYRVTSIKEAAPGRFEVMGKLHNPLKYSITDAGAVIETPEKSLMPSGPLTPPTNVTITARNFVEGGQQRQGVTVGWTLSTDPRTDQYQIQARSPEGTGWVPVGTAMYPPFEIDSEEMGAWQIRVAGITSYGVQSSWAVADAVVHSNLDPLPPENVQTSSDNFTITLTSTNARRPTQDYEVWRSTYPLSGASQIITNAVRVGFGRTVTDTGLSVDTVYYYYVRGYNLYGVSEFYPVQAKTQLNPTEYIKVLHNQLGKSELSNALAGDLETTSATADKSLKLALDAAKYAEEQVNKLNARISNLPNSEDALKALRAEFDGITQQVHNATGDAANAYREAQAAGTGIHAERDARVEADKAITKELDQATSRLDESVAILRSRLNTYADTSKAETARLEDAISALKKPNEDLLAMIRREEETRAQGDETLAKQINLVSAAQKTDKESVNAAILDERQARVSSLEATAKRLEEQKTEMDTRFAGVKTTTDTLSSRIETVADQTTKVAAATETVKSSVEQESKARVAGDLAQTQATEKAVALGNEAKAAVESERNARVEGQNSLVSSITSLRNDNNEFKSSFTQQVESVINGSGALSTRLNDLRQQTQDGEKQLSARITDVDKLVTAEHSQQAIRNQAMQVETLANSASIQVIDTAFATEKEATAQRFEQVRTSMGQTAAELGSLRSAHSDLERSTAERVERVAASVHGQGDRMAAIEERARAMADAQGKYSTQWTLKMQSDGVIAGIGLGISDGVSDFAVRADRFYITNPNGGNRIPAFSVVDNRVQINSAAIGYASIGTAQMAGQLCSREWYWNGDNDFGGLELRFDVGELRCTKAIIKGDITATRFTCRATNGNVYSEMTERGYKVYENGIAVVELGILD